jgi:hypothetical protein
MDPPRRARRGAVPQRGAPIRLRRRERGACARLGRTEDEAPDHASHRHEGLQRLPTPCGMHIGGAQRVQAGDPVDLRHRGAPLTGAVDSPQEILTEGANPENQQAARCTPARRRSGAGATAPASNRRRRIAPWPPARDAAAVPPGNEPPARARPPGGAVRQSIRLMWRGGTLCSSTPRGSPSARWPRPPAPRR